MARAAAPSQRSGWLTRLLDLPARIGALTGEAHARAARLVDVRIVTGRTVPPPELEAWLERAFGSVEAVREQAVVKITNLATLEGTLFAPLRARRPLDGSGRTSDLRAQIAATQGDPFCSPETGTPADAFGRVRGLRMVTGANAAVADANHAVLVFEEHDPLAFDAGLVADLFATGRAWAERARESDPGAASYLLLWNCLWRAGGSILHGHGQALLGAGFHYARVERLRRDAEAYRAAHGSGLVEDLVALHRDLGLAVERIDGVTIVANLAPIKERELLIVGTSGMDERDPSFTDAVAHALLAYRDRLGVRSFNLALWRSPLDGRWQDFAPIVRIVDRGDLAARPSDIGAMELYGTPIVGSDPYELVEALSGPAPKA